MNFPFLDNPNEIIVFHSNNEDHLFFSLEHIK